MHDIRPPPDAEVISLAHRGSQLRGGRRAVFNGCAPTSKRMDWQASLVWFSRRSGLNIEPTANDSEDEDDHPPAPGFRSPPPSPIEAEYEWPTEGQSRQTDDDFDPSFFNVDDLVYRRDPSQSSPSVCAAFTATDALDIEGPQDAEPPAVAVESWERRIITPEQAAELAYLNAAAVTAAQEATQALDLALASTSDRKDYDFDRFMSLVENACVSKSHATALKAIAEAAAERILAAQLFA